MLSIMDLARKEKWMIRVFLRTPDRLPKLFGSHVQLSEAWKAMVGTCKPGKSAASRRFLEKNQEEEEEEVRHRKPEVEAPRCA